MTESQSLFGIGYCFLFGIASAGAPRQVWTQGLSLAFSGSGFSIGA